MRPEEQHMISNAVKASRGVGLPPGKATQIWEWQRGKDGVVRCLGTGRVLRPAGPDAARLFKLDMEMGWAPDNLVFVSRVYAYLRSSMRLAGQEGVTRAARWLKSATDWNASWGDSALETRIVREEDSP